MAATPTAQPGGRVGRVLAVAVRSWIYTERLYTERLAQMIFDYSALAPWHSGLPCGTRDRATT